MQRNKTLTTINSYHRDLRVPSRDWGVELKLSSNSKIPKLQEVIEEWKFNQQVNNKDLDQSLLAPHSSVDSLDEFIVHLTKKIDFLQGKLNQLFQRHTDICSILIQQLQKKTAAQQLLRRQNIELNKEMKVVMEDMKTIINSLYNKDQGRLELDCNFKPKQEKQNIQPFNCIEAQISSRNSRDRRHSRKRGLLSGKNKLKSSSSVSKSPFKEEVNQEVPNSKTELINEAYYSKNQEYRVDNRQLLKFQSPPQEKSRVAGERHNNKKRQACSYY